MAASGRAFGAVLAGILLTAAPCAFALNPALDVSQYAHASWKYRDGFTKGQIQDIAQTPDGYLWLATQFGLFRFDGVRAVPWQPPPDQPLPSSLIGTLVAARDGSLWIGTRQGLASWKNGRVTRYAELAGLSIFALLEDHEGTIWVGGYRLPEGKFCEIRKGSVRCHTEMGGLGAGVWGLHEDRKGNLWAELQTGVWRWKPGPSQFYPVPFEPVVVQDMADGEDGALLIATKGALWRLADGKAEVAYPLPAALRNSITRRMLRDRDGGLWVGTTGGGIAHIYQGRTDVFSRSDGLTDDSVSRFFEDREGDIWVATSGGLDRFHELPVVTYSTDQGLPTSNAGAVIGTQDGSVWFAARGELDRLNNGQLTAYHQRSDRARAGVPEVAVDGLRDLGSTALLLDSRGRIWVSTQKAIGYLENDRFVPSALPGGTIGAITEDTNGNLWIANQNLGFFRLSPSNEVQQIPWPRSDTRTPGARSPPIPRRAFGSDSLGAASPGFATARCAHPTPPPTGWRRAVSLTYGSMGKAPFGSRPRAGSAV